MRPVDLMCSHDVLPLLPSFADTGAALEKVEYFLPKYDASANDESMFPTESHGRVDASPVIQCRCAAAGCPPTSLCVPASTQARPPPCPMLFCFSSDALQAARSTIQDGRADDCS